LWIVDRRLHLPQAGIGKSEIRIILVGGVKSMECEKVRDRFSALLEKELSPSDESVVREHLAFCSECQNDFERFEKTIRWLHVVEEVEVPDGFLSGIYKKMESRKREGLLTDQVKRRWLNYPASLKLPIQAVAMVTTICLVLYLTKMMPFEGSRLKVVEQTKAPHSEAKKMGAESIPEEMKKERDVLQPPLEKPGLRDNEPARAPVSGAQKAEGAFVPKVIEEEKRALAPAPKTERAEADTLHSQEAWKAKAAPSESEKMENVAAAREKISFAAKPPREIILRISDRAKIVSQLQELIKGFGGETVTAEENILLASLPAASFSEFEKELNKLGSSAEPGKRLLQKDAQEGLSAPAGVRQRGVEEKAKEPARPAAGSESYITVRILLRE